MNFLGFLGLDSWNDNICALFGNVVSDGRVYEGYYGSYATKAIGSVEITCNLAPCEGGASFAGFSMDVIGDKIWNLEVTILGDKEADREDIEREGGRQDYLDSAIFFMDSAHDKNVAINLINADIVPDFYPGDRYIMRIVAVAYDVYYYDSVENFDKDIVTTAANGMPIRFGMDNVISFGKVSIAIGRVISVTKKASIGANNENIEFYSVEINTSFGILEIVHAESAIKAEHKNLVKPGSIIKAVCYVMGDVAFGEYENGPIFDESHLVRLLRWCYEHWDFTRFSQVISRSCNYVDSDGIVQAHGGKKVLNYLKKLMPEDTYLLVYLAQIVKYKGSNVTKVETNVYEVGQNCLALPMNEENTEFMYVFVKLDKKGKISEIRCTELDSKEYEIKIRFPEQED